MGDSERSPNTWRRSSASGGSNCVEVSITGEAVLMRDSQDRDGPVLSFSHPEWEAFIAGVVGGEFNT